MRKSLYTLLLALLCFTFSNLQSQVSENFDTNFGTSYNSYSLPSGFNVANGLSESGKALTGRAVRLRDSNSPTPSLTYVGSDGDGKDGGVGTVSFYYRHWDGRGGAITFQVEYDNGSGWTAIGSPVTLSGSTDSYTQFSQTPNIAGDDIQVRVNVTSPGERLIIDDFAMTNYTACTAQVTMDIITPTGYADLDNQGNNSASGPICSGDQLVTVQSTTTPNDGNGNNLWIRSVNTIPANVTTFQLVPGTVHVPYAAPAPPFFLQFGDMFINTGTQPETVTVVVTPYFETNPAPGASLDENTECFGPDITIEVIVNPSPSLTALTPEVCSEEADDVDLTQFEALAGVPAVLPVGATVEWYRGDSSTGTDVTASKASVTVADGEIFTVVYTDDNDCSGEATVTFAVNKVDCGGFPWQGDN
ncbi:MAG: hypothetical protein AB8F95_16615 [Bacteroidia bacterium]